MPHKSREAAKAYYRCYNEQRPLSYYHEAKQEGGERWQRVLGARKRSDETRREKYRISPEGWVRGNAKRTKCRCARMGIPFALDPAAIEAPEKCPILGIVLNYASSGRDETCPSFDRIRPDLGYIDGNVRVISRLANRIRQNCTDATIFDALAADTRRLFGG